MTRSHPFSIVCGCSSMTTEIELKQLLELGADEIYVGYVPQKWLDTIGMEVSPNRRYVVRRQITDMNTLCRYGEMTRSYGSGFMVTLNEHYYTPMTRKMIPDILEASMRAGATGFIVADLALLRDLAMELSGSHELIVSGEAGIYNTHSARKFVELGASRLTFPREMRLSEMESIIASLQRASLTFEAFIAREYCMNSSAYCLVTHGYDYRSHFCCAHSERLLYDIQSKQNNHIHLSTPSGPPSAEFIEAVSILNRCGFCALEKLLAMGVTFLKIPGRSSSALRALQLLTELLQRGNFSPQTCQQIVGSPEFCSSGHHCYYNLDDATSQKTEKRCRPDTSLSRGSPVVYPGSDGKEIMKKDVSFSKNDTKKRPPGLGVYLSAGTYDRGIIERLKRKGMEGIFNEGEFAGEWEYNIARNALDLLSRFGIESDTRPECIYLGMECCALRLMDSETLFDEMKCIQDKGFQVALVTPIAYQFIYPVLYDILETILGASHQQVELVINDLGLLLQAASHFSCRIATGRMFNRMKRYQFNMEKTLMPASDGLFRNQNPSDQDHASMLKCVKDRQLSCYGHPYLNDPFYRDMLLDNKVESIGMDILPTPLSDTLSPSFDYTVYMPWTYLTSGRACAVAASFENTSVSYPTDECNQSCSRYLMIPGYPWKHRRIIVRGASTFMDCTDDIIPFFDSMKPCPDRLVFEPFVPY